MLIFFLVTASFVKESGVEIQRPEAASAQDKPEAGLFIGITEQGEIFIDKTRVDLRSVRGMVEHFLLETPSGSVVMAFWPSFCRFSSMSSFSPLPPCSWNRPA